MKGSVPDEPYWNPLVPEFTVAKLAASLAFYQAIGFGIRYQRREPDFAYIELGQAQLMLEQEHPTGWNVLPLDRPLGRGINFQIQVPDLVCVTQALAGLGVPIFSAPQEAWYSTQDGEARGQRALLVQDPDGYLLRFAQCLGSRKSDA